MSNPTGNSVVYEEDWAESLQESLDEPTIYKEICTVDISNQRVFHNPYDTDPSVQTGTRGSTYTYEHVSHTDESVTVNTFKIIPQFLDRADLAQSRYAKQMRLAERQGVLLNEAIETAIYADHANMTDIGDDGTGAIENGETTQIDVSATNIDDIVRAIKREIRVAEGEQMFNRNGGFFVWRPEDFELLEQFMQANGFNTADRALEDGAPRGVNYMGFTHYSSNLLASNHVVAGVKKAPWVGILRDTFGQVVVTQEPGDKSGVSVVSRVDFKEKIWNNVKPIVYDVNVA